MCKTQHNEYTQFIEVLKPCILKTLFEIILWGLKILYQNEKEINTLHQGKYEKYIKGFSSYYSSWYSGEDPGGGDQGDWSPLKLNI